MFSERLSQFSSPVPCVRTPQAVIEAWDAGIGRLVDAGVTGTIMLANVASVKGLAVSAKWKRAF